MPEAMIQEIRTNGCLEESFDKNIKRDLRSVEEIKDSLQTFRSTLADATTGYQKTLAGVRQTELSLLQASNTPPAELAQVTFALTVADISHATKEAVAGNMGTEELEEETL